MDPSIPLPENLARLADALKVTDDVERRGNILLDKLLKKIKEKTKHKIHRVIKAGSLGKKTAISLKVDYDCVFLIDDVGRDFRNKFLDDLEEILTLHENVKVDRTKNSIGFSKDGFSFDFLPGKYLSQFPEQSVKALVKHATASVAEYKNVRTALVEGTVLFMKSQTSFTHRLARLLKYWSHTVLVPGFFNGRSYTLELFAIWASDELRELHGGRECLLQGFRVALVKIRNFMSARKAWNYFYESAEHKKRFRGPVLLDVADPKNNLLEEKRIPFFEKLSEYATVTLERLSALQLGVPMFLLDLFEQQPKIWDILQNVPQEGSWLVGTAKTLPEGQILAQPRIEARKHAQYLKKELEMYAHVCSARMERDFFVKKEQYQNPTAKDIQKLAESCVDSIFGNNRGWIPATIEKFEDKEVELVLPVCRFANNNKYVQIGFDVKRNTQFNASLFSCAQSIAYWDDVDDNDTQKLGGA